jgi:hypothetical protein
MNTEVDKFTGLHPEMPVKPLRVALSATGITKNEISEVKMGRKTFLVWNDVSLRNLAVPGEDYAALTGEDALVAAHVGKSNDPRHTYKLVDQTTVPSDMFLAPGLPLPVATPVDREPTESVLLAVADGVGGMADYGELNTTALMSHELMRELRNNLTHDTFSAKALLRRSWSTLRQNNRIQVGACTAAVALLKPVKENVFESARYAEEIPTRTCPFDDGQRLQLHYANLGDSTVVAFRPRPGPTGMSYIPLTAAWPMHHKHHTANAPPVQLCIMQEAAPNKVQHPEHDPAALRTSGSARPYYTKDSYEAFAAAAGEAAGQDPEAMTDADPALPITKVDQEGKYSLRMDYGHFADEMENGDQPWLANEGTALLQRGDVVCVFSDGVGDNLMLENFCMVLSEAHQSVAAFVNDKYRTSVGVTRVVGPFRGDVNENPNHADAQKYKAELEKENPEKADEPIKSIDCETECTVAGNMSSMFASSVVRLCQKGWKVDDISLVVGVVY